MFFEMTIQMRVDDFLKGRLWYIKLLQRQPDFEPHEGIAEWEIVPGSWLQLAEGTPGKDSGPLRLGVEDIETERHRLVSELDVDEFSIYTRDEVPVHWATFLDPWGNRLGLFEYKNKLEEKDRIQTVLGRRKV
ncbi:VOC family protein [Salinibacillus aidingensis]|uniref:VOC family protein n=1 Tax=Salinibacillus aidingensis TaxID=237684 RepID=A0ABN1BB95_9BACI